MSEKYNIFDTPNLDLDASGTSGITREELVQELIPKVQHILNKRFPGNRQRQTIKVNKDTMMFAAPCCGDSASDDYKKRGNIILDGKFKNLYKCHNCGCCMSVYKFLRTYDEDLSLRVIDYMVNNAPDHDKVDANKLTAVLYDTDIIDEYAIERGYFKTKCNLVECTGTYAQKYLYGRMQYNLDKFLYHPKHNLLFVLNLTERGKIIGAQVRSLNPNGPRGYKTYKLSKLYSLMMHEERTIPEEIENLSMMFNILLIDYNKPITVLEGPLDSFLINNAIATCGAGNRMKYQMRVRYMFDDDKTGREHAIEKINNGYQIFLWDKLKEDISLPRKNPIGSKWDMNDLVLWTSRNGVKIPDLSSYFSNNPMDIIYL